MKIACIDKTAADRLALQAAFNKAFELCRDTLGYVTLSNTFPATKDDVLHGSQPGAVAIGPAFPIEDAFLLVKELRAKHPNIPILVFLAEATYNLRSLRRFQPYTSEIFVKDESPVRLIYRLSYLADAHETSLQGRLITVTGVKGGVGSTSIVAALAHSAMSHEKSACIVDLSRHSSVAHFLAADHFHSPDYASAIIDSLSVNRALVERCLCQTPCGLSILLPPAGGTDIRELWQRNHSSFEITLSFLEHLREIFDLVIVDCANTEGILPFAIMTRADTRLVVTTNEPASVHLLAESFSDILNAPGNSQSAVIFNLLYQNSLSSDDILDYLYTSDRFDPQRTKIYSVPFDPRARHWIGSRNSFYTESNSRTQTALDEILKHMLKLDSKETSTFPAGSYFKRLFRKTPVNKPAFPLRPVLAISHESVKTPPQPTLSPDSSKTEESATYEEFFESPLELYGERKGCSH